VGIDLTIDPKEPAVLTSITQSLSWTDLAYSSMGGLGTAFVGTNYSAPALPTPAVNDPFIEGEITKMVSAVATKGQKRQTRFTKELMKYVLTQAYVIPFPKAPGYRLWWPWVKNYHNEFAVGYWNEGNWSKWAWIDQNLKAQMLGKLAAIRRPKKDGRGRGYRIPAPFFWGARSDGLWNTTREFGAADWAPPAMTAVYRANDRRFSRAWSHRSIWSVVVRAVWL